MAFMVWPTLEKIRDRLSGVKLWLQVADASGNALLPGALDYEQALDAAVGLDLLAPPRPSAFLAGGELR